MVSPGHNELTLLLHLFSHKISYSVWNEHEQEWLMKGISRAPVWSKPIGFSIKLTHWGRVTHICVDDLTTPGSDNGLSPGRRQAIIRTNAGILLIGPLATNFSDILIEVLTFSFKKMRLKVSSAKWWPSCLGLSVLSHWSMGYVLIISKV